MERKSLRKCFRNNIFSLVPYEIWRDLIVSYSGDVRIILLLSQTCRGFNNLVDDIGKTNINLALLLRREGQIPLALKYLRKCVDNGDSLAMFHLGYAYWRGGWGVNDEDDESCDKSMYWLERSAKYGNPHGMAFFAHFLRKGYYGVQPNIELSIIWGQKALSSNDPFAKGLFWLEGLGGKQDHFKAFPYFETSAKEGDEFGQYYFAKQWFEFGQYYLAKRWYNGTKLDYGFYWCEKSAQRGLYSAQIALATIHRKSLIFQDEKKALIWDRKVIRQMKPSKIIKPPNTWYSELIFCVGCCFFWILLVCMQKNASKEI